MRVTKKKTLPAGVLPPKLPFGLFIYFRRGNGKNTGKLIENFEKRVKEKKEKK